MLGKVKKAQTLWSWAEGLPERSFEDVALRRVAQVAGIGMGHQQLDLLESRHRVLGGLCIWDALLPAHPYWKATSCSQGSPVWCSFGS